MNGYVKEKNSLLGKFIVVSYDYIGIIKIDRSNKKQGVTLYDKSRR